MLTWDIKQQHKQIKHICKMSLKSSQRFRKCCLKKRLCAKEYVWSMPVIGASGSIHASLCKINGLLKDSPMVYKDNALMKNIHT